MDDIEKLETKLVKLQNDIEVLQKSNCLAHTEQAENSVNDRSEFKKNSLEIKQLEKQVGEIQVRLKRQQLNDFRIMHEKMCEKCREPPDLKAVSAKELLEKLEARVLDLNLKCQAQLHTLKHLERTFNDENSLLKKRIQTCRLNDISNEADCLQQIRHLENLQNKTLKNVEDCESANDKLKKMLKSAQKKQNSQMRLLMDLKNEQATVSQNAEKDSKEEPEECDNDDREKREKLEKLENEISLLKDVTCSSDVRDIDFVILEQKAVNKDLNEMAKKAEKRIIELKEEKRSIASKSALIREVDSMYPKSDDQLTLSKSRLKEQQQRLDSAKEVMDQVNSQTNRTKEVFQSLIVKMHPKVNKVEMNKKDVKQLSKQLENIVRFTFPR